MKDLKKALNGIVELKKYLNTKIKENADPNTERACDKLNNHLQNIDNQTGEAFKIPIDIAQKDYSDASEEANIN